MCPRSTTRPRAPPATCSSGSPTASPTIGAVAAEGEEWGEEGREAVLGEEGEEAGQSTRG